MQIGIDTIGLSGSTIHGISRYLLDHPSLLTITSCIIQEQFRVEQRKKKMNKDMLQAYKYYAGMAEKLSSTVPEAVGCNPTPPHPGSLNASYAKAAALKKEKNMYNERNTAISVTPHISIAGTEAFNAIETAQDHLIERLSDATEKKLTAAQRKFGMIDDERPRTPQSFVDRILGGKFFITEDRKNQYTYDPTDYIIWRDPSVKKDEAGFGEARTAINEASNDVMDILIVKGPEAGLAAINTFKTN